jgi:hypothetical protein
MKAGPSPTHRAALGGALEALQGDVNQLQALARNLSSFNAFEVMRITRAEIRHSNVLAWLLDSGESHGLGNEFAGLWFDLILREIPPALTGQMAILKKLHGATSLSLRTRREWGGQNSQGRKADILLEIVERQQVVAIVCIENKIRHIQSENQLVDYRNMVEACYRQVACKYYFLLSAAGEIPEDPAYIPVSYTSVCGALEAILSPSRSGVPLSAEVCAFLTQYHDLLKRYFMNDSQEMRLALDIYRKHRRAIDYIIEVRPDDRAELTRLVQEKLAESAVQLNIVLLRANYQVGLVRLAPKAWDITSNRAKDADDWCHTFCQVEICKGSSTPMLIATIFPRDENSGKILPEAAALHKAASEDRFPDASKDPLRKAWYAFYRLGADSISIENLPEEELDSLADHIFLWVKETIQSEGFSKMAGATAEILKKAL